MRIFRKIAFSRAFPWKCPFPCFAWEREKSHVARGRKSGLSNYSQGQKHVIQLKNSQELISPNMSSQFQLENSLELIFISIGRCQLDDIRGTPLEFCFGGPSLSARCGTNVLCPKIRDFPMKCSTLRLLEERPRDGKRPKIIDFPKKYSTLRRREERARVPNFIDFPRKYSTFRRWEKRARVPKSEIPLGNAALRDFWRRVPEWTNHSLGDVALWDAGKRGLETEIFPGKCQERGGEVSLGNVALWDAGVPKSEMSQGNVALWDFWRRGLETEILSWEVWHFERLWGGTLCPDGICQLNNSVFRKFVAVRSQLENSFELIFEICHLTFNFKLFWN